MKRIACLVFVALLGGCLFSSGTANNEEPNPDLGMGDPGDVDCPSGQQFCFDGCTPVAADVENCGMCGNDCEAAAPPGAHARGCVASVCVFECDAGLADDDEDLQLSDGNGCESDCMPSDEVCDGVDNDCDGSTDEELTQTYYLDGDDDGAGNPAATAEFCPGAAEAGWVENADDCDDERDDRAPGREEICDGIDNDCDQMIDEDAVDYFLDEDNDGFGGLTTEKFCDDPGLPWSATGGDCDDMEPTVNPGLAEICDGLDNNCDGVTPDATNPDCEHIIFVTSGQYPSNFNRNDGADAICASFGLNISNSNGNWRAIISTPGEDAIDRIRQVGPIKDVQGNVLWPAGGLFADPPMGAVSVQEDAVALTFGDKVEVWTGTLSTGLAGANCAGFTVVSETDAGVSGSAIESGQWLQATSGNCMGEQRIYCIDGQP